MNICTERDWQTKLDHVNVYLVKVNGKVQGRVTFNKGKFGILGDDRTNFDTQDAAAIEVARRNGRKVPKDVKVRHKKNNKPDDGDE
jgi:hypothetical protein